MPSRFELTSPGSGLMSGIEKELMKRELERQRMVLEARQREQDELARRKFEEDIALRKQGQENLEGEKRFRRATTMATTMPKGELSGEAADLLTQEGYGGMVDIEASPEVPQSEIDTLKPSQIPGVISTQGGTNWQAARAAEQARKDAAAAQQRSTEAIAEGNRISREEIAKRADATDRMIAALNASTRNVNADLQRQLLQGKIDEQTAKALEARQGRERGKQSTELALGLAKRLTDPADVGANLEAATGAVEMKGYIPEAIGGSMQGVTDFNSVRDQLVAALALPNLGQLKGPMSDKDVIFVKQLATRLQNTRMSEGETKRSINEAIAFLEHKLSGAEGDFDPRAAGGTLAPGANRGVGAGMRVTDPGAAGAAPGGTQRRRRWNPATGRPE